jgi:hypothetical protein
MKENIGGPNFIRLPDESLWAAGLGMTACSG